MSDRYGELVQSSLGRKVAKNLGLPTPIKLDRYEAGQPVILGEVALGISAGDDHSVRDALVQILGDQQAKVSSNTPLSALATTAIDERLTDDNARFKVVIFDATNIKNADELKQVYDFFSSDCTPYQDLRSCDHHRSSRVLHCG